MKKILALNNISLVESVYSDLTSRNIAYTKKLLELDIIIDFNGVPTADKEEFREETNVHATIYRDGKFCHYLLLSTTEILGPLVISRLIIDAVAVINTCDKDTIMQELKGIASEYQIVDENHKDKEYYKVTTTEYFDAIRVIKKSMQDLY